MTSNFIDSSSLQVLQDVMQAYVDRGDLPGLAYHVEKRGQRYSGRCGIATASGTPIRRDSIFRIASLSKPIVGAATLKLIETGTLRLDQSVEQLVPELAELCVLRSIDSQLDNTAPLARSITIEDLLTFRMGSGIVLAPPNTFPIQRATEAAGLGIGPPDPANVPAPDEWLRRFARLPLLHQPGDEWMYVTSSEILGIVLSRAANLPLPELLDEVILKPLDMVDTAFHVPANKVDRFTSQFVRSPKSQQLVESDPPINGNWNQIPAFPSAGGGLMSTIDDFSSFARMLLNLGRHQGNQFLSKWSVDQMTRNHLTDGQRRGGEVILGEGNGWGYCLAVRVGESRDPGRPGSYGWNGGFGTTWLNDPAEEMIAVLFTQVQFDSSSLPDSARTFLNLAYQI